jgi:hypothetical protein
MKNIQQHTGTKLPRQKLEAPLVLTPDQIASIAAGALSLAGLGGRPIVYGGIAVSPDIGVAKAQTQV